MVLRERRVHKAIQVPQEFQVQMAAQDLKDTQACQEHQEKAVRWEGQDPWDKLVPLVQQAPKDSRATQVFQAHLAQLA